VQEYVPPLAPLFILYQGVITMKDLQGVYDLSTDGRFVKRSSSLTLLVKHRHPTVTKPELYLMKQTTGEPYYISSLYPYSENGYVINNRERSYQVCTGSSFIEIKDNLY
jgi:hypothetical protein